MLGLIRDTAIKAGRLLNIRFMEMLNGKVLEIREKGKSDFVTRVDVEVEYYIKDLLSGTGVPVVGEEGFTGDVPGTCFFVDPIDGTRNFMRGNPHFAVNIAFVERGSPVCGVTYNPVGGDLFEAVRGGGAFLNGEKIKVSVNGDLSRALVAIGLPYKGRELVDVQVELYRKLFLSAAATRHTGSAALDLAYVACGRYDAAIYFYLSPWDVASGILLVEEAGGVVSGLMGRSSIEGWLVASNGVIEKELRKLLPGGVL